MSDIAGNRSSEMTFLAKMQQTMDEFARQWSRGNIDGLMALVSEDPTYRTSGGAVFQGRENVRLGFTQICKPTDENSSVPASPRLHFFDNICVSYWTLALPGIDGKPASVDGVDIITFDAAGKISCKDAYRKLS